MDNTKAFKSMGLASPCAMAKTSIISILEQKQDEDYEDWERFVDKKY
ncbi:MAG: hypothetical protein AB4426_07270 [Xenococcaceae cyanobacterium]